VRANAMRGSPPRAPRRVSDDHTRISQHRDQPIDHATFSPRSTADAGWTSLLTRWIERSRSHSELAGRSQHREFSAARPDHRGDREQHRHRLALRRRLRPHRRDHRSAHRMIVERARCERLPSPIVRRTSQASCQQVSGMHINNVLSRNEFFYGYPTVPVAAG